MKTSSLVGEQELGQMGQNQMLRDLDRRLNSSHFTLLVREAIYVLVRGKYDSQMVWGNNLVQ